MTIQEQAAAKQAAQDSAAWLLQRAGVERIDIALVLGSGWKDSAPKILDKTTLTLDMSEIPGFLAPTVKGHGGQMIIGETANGKVAALLLGRTHFYEGHPVTQVVHGVRTMAYAGVQQVILTNAAGGILPTLKVGDVAIINDHINFAGTAPLAGAEFVNMVDAYSPRLRALIQEANRRATGSDEPLTETVYCIWPGPMYETPAEINMFRICGAGLTGMSTGLETIALRALGVEVAALSLVTNMAAGITGEALDHTEVLDVAGQSADRLGALLGEIVNAL